MRLVLLLLLAACLTGCVPQYPCYCEENNAPICYVQRRPIFASPCDPCDTAPRQKPTSAPKPERRDGELPDSVPRCLFRKSLPSLFAGQGWRLQSFLNGC